VVGDPLYLNSTKFVFGRGYASDPAGELRALPQIPSWFKEALLLRGKGGEEREENGKERRGREGRGRGRPPLRKFLDPFVIMLIKFIV